MIHTPRLPVLAFALLLLFGARFAAAQEAPPPAPQPAVASDVETAPVEEVAEPGAAPAGEPQGALAAFAAVARQALFASGFERREMTAPTGRLVYWVGGPAGGSGGDLVLVHGAGDHAGGWFQVAGSLTEERRVWILDLPGHGESEPAAGPLRFGDVQAGLEAFLEHRQAELEAEAGEGARPPVLVGNSMGAWLALLVARDRPELAGRVVAVNGGGLEEEGAGLALMPESREEARALLGRIRDPGSVPVPDYLLDDLIRHSRQGPVGRLMQALPEMEARLLDGTLDRITVPVDLLWGESDQLLPLAYAERLAEGLPRARLTTLPKCGHIPQNECPMNFLATLEQVLDQAPPSPKAAPAPAPEGAEGTGG